MSKQRLVVVPRARVAKRDPFWAIVAILFACMAYGLIAGCVFTSATP